MFSALRPVGNFFDYVPRPLENSTFAPFQLTGYQSGTAALAASILLAKSQHPDIVEPEVIIPAYTCPDILSACQFAGVKVRIVDLEESRPWMDPERLQELVTARTIAVIAINFLGIPERIELIRSKIGNEKIVIIEDSAQGFPIIDFDNYWKGDLVVLSFGRGKPLSLFGGGAILTRENDSLPQLTKISRPDSSNQERNKYKLKLSIFKLLSTPFLYYWLTKVPFLKIGKTEFKPLHELTYLPEFIEDRLESSILQFNKIMKAQKEITAKYQTINSELVFDITRNIQLPDLAMLRYPILIRDAKKKEHYLKKLEQEGLGASSMYQKVLSEIENIPKEIILGEIIIPNARKFASQLITLPCHGDVKKQHVDAIISVLES